MSSIKKRYSDVMRLMPANKIEIINQPYLNFVDSNDTIINHNDTNSMVNCK